MLERVEHKHFEELLVRDSDLHRVVRRTVLVIPAHMKSSAGEAEEEEEGGGGGSPGLDQGDVDGSPSPA